MADVKISQLPASTTPLDGTEVLPIVQSATTKQVSVANLTAGRAMAASSLTLTTPLAVTSGGTGLSTTAAGTLLSSTALNTVSATATPSLGVASTTSGTLSLYNSSSANAVTIASGNNSGAWTFTLPTSGGTNNYILTTNGSGTTQWTNPTALGIDLDVGTTAITGGTTGRVLYDNGGFLGEYSSVPVSFGGTGLTSLTAGRIPFGNGTGAFSNSANLTFISNSLNILGTSKVGTGTSALSATFGIINTVGSVTGFQLFQEGVESWIIGMGSSSAALTFGNSGTERMRLDSAGNLGLGVTPSAWRSGARAFQSGANGYVALWEQASGAANLSFGAYEGSANTFNYRTTGDAPTLYSQLSGAHKWYNAASGTAGGTISFTQAMTLDASGNLGIGTSSPNKRFSVINGGSTQFTIDTAAGANDLIKFDTYNASSVKGVYTWSQQGSEVMRIDASGNVGIGTSSPTAKLDVYGSGGGSTGYVWEVQSAAIGGSGTAGAAANNGGVLSFDGTFTTGNDRANLAWIRAAKTTSTSGDAMGNLILGARSGNIIFTNDPASGGTATERMRIDTSGNLLVGTTTVGALLTVAGPVSLQQPSTKTANYSLTATDSSLIFNGSGSITLTLQAASSYPGRILYVKTIAAQTVVSASSNVVPVGSATAGTAILAATAGKWAMLQSDGTNWIIMAAN